MKYFDQIKDYFRRIKKTHDNGTITLAGIFLQNVKESFHYYIPHTNAA